MTDWNKGTSVGGEAMRETGIPDNLGGRLTHGRHVERAPVEAPTTLPAEGQVGGKLDKPEAGGDPLARLDAEDIATWRRQLEDGTFSPAELQRLQALTDAEMAAITTPPKPASRASVERDLAEIRGLRQSDSKRYWSEPTQQRELELLSKLEGLKAAPAAEVEKSEDLGEIEAELQKIAQVRKTDRRAYDKDADLQARELELLEAREKAKETMAWQEQARTKVQAVLDSVEDAQAFEEEFTGVLGSLSERGQDVVKWHLGQPAADSTLRASAEELERLSALGPNCASLIKSWGREAPRRAATAEAALRGILDAMGGADRAKAERFLKAQSDATKAAIIGMLAG
jgi:hypothetical protein